MPIPHPNMFIQHVPIYVFDLDDVLMPTEALFNEPRVKGILSTFCANTTLLQISSAYQQFISHNQTLVNHLSAHPVPHYLLTNGSHSHAIASTNALGILPYFSSIVHSQSGAGMKPEEGPYLLTENMIRNQYIQHDPSFHYRKLPPIVFFDDRVENHVYPKQRGWTTVWIVPNAHNQTKPAHVDYMFSNVYQALHFFKTLFNQTR